MTETLLNPEYILPIIFAALTALAVIVYVILDGYDLGVGILMRGESEADRDKMIASIGPFWDANETWLVLAVGLLLIAFPQANGIILTALYMPVLTMLIGLILRGVSFELRAKVRAEQKNLWDGMFVFGSYLTAASQGYMLGLYVMGLDNGFMAHGFGVISAIGVAAAYALIGSGWLIMKTEGDLQKRAVTHARNALAFSAIGVGAVSVVTPMVNPEIFTRWFSFPGIIALWPIPVVTVGLGIALEFFLRKAPYPQDRLCWVPFVTTTAIFLLCFNGLLYSFYPNIAPNLTIWDAASDTEALVVILIGAGLVVPFILLYTIFSYRVFWGKVGELRYY